MNRYPVWKYVVIAVALLVGFDAKSAQAIGLALDEALANVINHGYEGRPDQPIHVEFQMREAAGEAEKGSGHWPVASGQRSDSEPGTPGSASPPGAGDRAPASAALSPPASTS